MLIRCEDCQTVYLAQLPTCPSCGRCPGCGRRRVTSAELSVPGACPGCGTPHCGGCGWCHTCGAVRAFDIGPCACGHPTDPARLAAVEKAFGYRHSGGSFC